MTVVLAAIFAAITTYRASAQTASSSAQAVPTTAQVTAPATTENPVVLAKFVVTGSNIPMAAEALAIPVATLGGQTIAESGVASDMLDLVRKVQPNISGIGQENAQISTGSTYGGAEVSIKGLPTLVLINGRRLPTDPAESQGGNQFVNMNLIPTAAVDRIEVLQDGASAVYGSDAVGGVINIILKKDYNGWELGSHYGYTTNTGRYSERSGYLVGGVSTDKTSITVGVDYAQHDAIKEAARPYTNPIYGTHSYPGVVDSLRTILWAVDTYYQLAPGVNAPPGGGTLHHSTVGHPGNLCSEVEQHNI